MAYFKNSIWSKESNVSGTTSSIGLLFMLLLIDALLMIFTTCIYYCTMVSK